MASLIAIIGAALALSSLTETSAQLFPFSALRSYIDQQHTDLIDQTTKAPPPVDAYRYLQESESQYDSAGAASNIDLTERTVIVTPKPKYVPQRLVPEPKEDPNSPNIPSIGYGAALGVSSYKSKERLSLSSASTPLRSVTIERPSEPPKKENKFQPILLKEKPPKVHYFEKTYVDSIPSLSVQIPAENQKRKPTDGILDYLVPPKFGSVYENHVKSLESGPPPENSLFVGEDEPPILLPTKTKKKKKNKNKIKVDPSISGSENAVNRVRMRGRPSHKHKKVSSVSPIELQASGTEVYNKPSSSPPYRPSAAPSTLHPIEEQIAAETKIGLEAVGSGGKERVEFQLHGQNGPESYKFGFDTGGGKNRHFRYEEKDQKGNVKGHYGYYDKTGKLQVVNYHADEHGFHASSP
ncbi:Insect cuticle protein [Nesidiocoris tenuis]|uniref:Insect cuticle protein n=1 Tax=Nesidiocoris tenuis TaxID=355587 RepID=A0ABN7BAE9_9HEMI|nr:Insect cuticle protein [Nesidiocoris tenuis]